MIRIIRSTIMNRESIAKVRNEQYRRQEVFFFLYLCRCYNKNNMAETQQAIDNAARNQSKSLELLAKQVVEGFIVGLHRSPFHGFSVEFSEHRLYNQGETTRHIDWKVYGRTDKMFTKKYEEETNLRCHIIVDASSTMYYPWDEKHPEKTRDKNKFHFSAVSAAAIMLACQKQRDAFGLSLFDTDLKLNTGAKSSTVHYRLLLGHLEQHLDNPKLGIGTNAAPSLHTISEAIHRRSLVVIFTDVLEQIDKAEELFSALQHLRHNKHEVVLFHVTDKSKEIDFEFENRPYLFVDMETGEELRLQPNQIKEYYTQQVNDFFQQLKLRCLQYHIDFVEADINKGYQQVLQTWMAKRSKML